MEEPRPEEESSSLLEFSLDAAFGAAKGAWHGTMGAVGDAVLQLHDTIMLPLWAVRQRVDEVQQFIESGQINSLRFGPAPTFTPQHRIALPEVRSGLVKSIERGVPSIIGSGPAGSVELVARSVPIVNFTFAAHDATRALKRGDGNTFGMVVGSVGVAMAVGGVAARPKTMPETPAWMAAYEQAPGSIASSNSSPTPFSGPVRAPREPTLLPRAERPSPMDRVGQPPEECSLAAIDNELGNGEGSGSLPSTTKLQPLASAKEYWDPAHDAIRELGFNPLDLMADLLSHSPEALLDLEQLRILRDKLEDIVDTHPDPRATAFAEEWLIEVQDYINFHESLNRSAPTDRAPALPAEMPEPFDTQPASPPDPREFIYQQAEGRGVTRDQLRELLLEKGVAPDGGGFLGSAQRLVEHGPSTVEAWFDQLGLPARNRL